MNSPVVFVTFASDVFVLGVAIFFGGMILRSLLSQHNERLSTPTRATLGCTQVWVGQDDDLA